jgi:Protein of unknown function (DUF3108)
MDLLRPLDPAWRAAAVALTVSAALHGTALVGLRAPEGGEASLEAPSYEATLSPAAVAEPAPAAPPAPTPRARPRKAESRPGETVAFLPFAAGDALLPLAPGVEPAAPMETLDEVVALAMPAQPAAPPQLPAFRPDALPHDLTIAYALTSSFADGQAEYTWKREGEQYEITGSAQATGFFTLFLEGRIDQSASGRVTPGGLRPDLFTERRGETPEEGLKFDWDTRQVEFRRGDSVRSAPLTDATVDWLSMIFQLAHAPPSGEALPLRVFTQRRLYEYRLQVLGAEEIDLPFGRVRAIHLRHAGDKPEETVDVWLGVDQYYLPVKLRYPVARNRLMVEQTATSVRAR